MLGFNKEVNLKLVIQEKENFSSMLLKLASCLSASGNNGQLHYIEKLLELINEDDWDQFVNSLNSVNMWED